jgi:hypothetical protein
VSHRTQLSSLLPLLPLLDDAGSTVTEVAARAFGQQTQAATNRARVALGRLEDVGLVRSVQTPQRAVWYRTNQGQAWVEQTSIVDAGRSRFGAGMVRW